MMFPEEIDKVADYIAKPYLKLEQEIFKLLAQRFITLSHAEFEELLIKFFNDINNNIEALIDEAVNKSFKKSENNDKKATNTKYLFALIPFLKDTFARIYTPINTSNTGIVIYNKWIPFYQSSYFIDEMITNPDTFNTFIDNLIDKGVRYAENGKIYGLDGYIRNNTITSVNQGTTHATEKLLKDRESDLVAVTAHIGARPSHAEWQGKIYSFYGKNKKYPPLTPATQYGEVTGLCGINCRHSFYIIDDPKDNVYTKEELKDYKDKTITYNGKIYTAYESTQIHRKFEQSLRNLHIKKVFYEELGNEAKLKEYTRKYTQKMKEYKSFAAVSGFNIRINRIK